MLDILYYIIAAVAGAGLGCGITYFLRHRKSGLEERERKYFLRGAYLLLEEKWDDAVDEFSKIAQTDSDKPDLYFVLGRLFRRKAAYERAIQVHQDLIMRSSLDKNTRLKAQYELALDYRDAGMLKRSQKTFEEIIKISPQWGQAYRELAALALLNHDWKQARVQYQRLQEVSGKKDLKLYGHLYAAQALDLLEDSNVDEALKLLKRSLGKSESGAHVYYAFSRAHAAQGLSQEAFRALVEAIDVQPQAAWIILPEIKRQAELFNSIEEYDSYLFRMIEEGRRPAHAFKLAQAERFIEKGEEQSALDILNHLARLNVSYPPFVKTASRMGIMPENGFEEGSSYWKCSNCGHKMPALDWHCPSCLKWDTYFPEVK